MSEVKVMLIRGRHFLHVKLYSFGGGGGRVIYATVKYVCLFCFLRKLRAVSLFESLNWNCSTPSSLSPSRNKASNSLLLCKGSKVWRHGCHVFHVAQNMEELTKAQER